MLSKEEQINSVVHLVELRALEMEVFSLTLINSDWYVLGEGYYSSVYGNSNYPDIVIKVNHIRGDSWPFYAKFCKDNEDNAAINKHLPVIHKFQKLRDRELYVAVLDKYECITPEYYEDEIDYYYSDCPRKQRCSFEDIVDIKSGLQGSYYAYDNYGRYRDHYDDAEERNSELFQVSCIIHDELSDYCCIDIHFDNFMLDKDGVVIITDPVSHTNSSTEDLSID